MICNKDENRNKIQFKMSLRILYYIVGASRRADQTEPIFPALSIVYSKRKTPLEQPAEGAEYTFT